MAYKKTLQALEIIKEFLPEKGMQFTMDVLKEAGYPEKNLVERIHRIKNNYGIKEPTSIERILQRGYITIKTPWNKLVAKTLFVDPESSNKYLWVAIETENKREICVRINLEGKALSGLKTKIKYNPDLLNEIEVPFNFVYRKHITGVKNFEFYCIRCNTIHDKTFASQSDDSRSKCKTCYNLSRAEYLKNNKQAAIRARLHNRLVIVLKTRVSEHSDRLNKSDLVREALQAGLWDTKEIANYIEEHHNVKLEMGSLSRMKSNVKRRDEKRKRKKIDLNCLNIHDDHYYPIKYLIGCSPHELRKWIENQFEEGWTHENRGKVWELDHIIPYSHYDLTDFDQVKKVMHYTNLRPLLIKDNRSKKGRVDK